MIGFIYVWKDKLRNMYYVGSHIGTPDDGYISSSRWLNFEYQYRPQDFRRRIIKEVDIENLKIEEYQFICMIKPHEFGKKYYNLKIGAPKGTTPWNKGTQGIFSEEHRKKISQSKIGHAAWNKGTPNPLGAKNGRKGAKKLSETAKGRKRFYKEDGSWTWQYPENK